MDNQIRLKHFQITELNFKTGTFDKEATGKFRTTSFNVTYGFSDEDETSYAVTFTLGLVNPDKTFDIKVVAIAHFETKSPIDDEFKESYFLKINSPAIAFPYLRAFISNFTLNAGYKAIILPTFNFVKLIGEKEEKEAKKTQLESNRKAKRIPKEITKEKP